MPSRSSESDRTDNAAAVAQALSDQGEAALHYADLPAAAPILQEAVSRWRKLHEPISLAGALSNLGLTYVRLKEPAQAVPLLTEAVDLFNKGGKDAGEATALSALGEAYEEMGDHTHALAHLQAALSLRRHAGDLAGAALTIDMLALVCSAAGERLAELGYRREHLQTIRGIGDLRAEADASVKLAEVLSATGYDADAAAELQASAEIYERLGLLQEAGEVYLKLARAHFESGDLAATVAPLEKGLPMLRQVGTWSLQAEQWESFLSSRRMEQQLSGAIEQWRSGEPGGIDDIVELVKDRLAGKGPGFSSPVSEQLLGMIADSAARLASMSPKQPQPALPSTDELAAQDRRSTPDLIAALRDPAAPERRKAALALGVRGASDAVEPLVKSCEDRNQWVRMAAVRSLGKLKDPRAFDALSKRVVEDRDKEVRRSAATALGALDDKRAVDALTVALTDNYFRTVESADKALRKLKSAPNILVFMALLTHKDAIRRYAAADRLGRLGDVRAMEALIQEAENPDQQAEVRAAMLKALAKLKDRRGVEAALQVLRRIREASGKSENGAEPEVQLKQAALGVIAALGELPGLAPMTADLVPYLNDANAHVRYAAVKALGAGGDETAIPALQRIQLTDESIIQVSSERGLHSWRLRSAAAEAIGRIHTRCG